MSLGLCAYAVTRDHTLAPVGPAGIRLITSRGLALVVADVELAPFAALATNPAHWATEPAEDDPLVMLARRHDVVVRAVFEHQPVLPLRFGTILRDEQAAVRLLAGHHDGARARLDRVDGHREWGVRARAAAPEEPAAQPDGMSGTEYLAMRRDRLVATARTKRDAFTAAGALHEALTRHAAETVPRNRKSATPLLDAAYLVSADAEPAFHAEAACHGDLAVEVTGPWPPYSFVRLELSAQEVTHA